MQELNIFTVKYYLEAWFQSTLAADTPVNDLRLYNNLCSMLPVTTGAALSKFMERHLWYLNEVLITLTLIDCAVSPQRKRKILIFMRETPGSDDPPQNPTA